MAAYRRVATTDGGNRPSERDGGQSSSTGASAAAGSALLPAQSQSERISNKLHALAWVLISYAVASYTRVFRTAFTDERIVRPIFRLALGMFAVNVALTVYLTAYLPWKFPVTPKYRTPASSPAFWEVYCPRVIPTMTALGVAGSLLLCRACYPVWGFLTPLILGIVAMGMFFSLTLIP